jgi:hypothetical protein
MHKAEAIHKLYPNVATTVDFVAYDSDGNVVDYDEAAVDAEVAAHAYKETRAAAYPSIEDQLDDIYHNGIDAWKANILAVKQAHPKPEGN